MVLSSKVFNGLSLFYGRFVCCLVAWFYYCDIALIVHHLEQNFEAAAQKYPNKHIIKAPFPAALNPGQIIGAEMSIVGAHSLHLDCHDIWKKPTYLNIYILLLLFLSYPEGFSMTVLKTPPPNFH